MTKGQSYVVPSPKELAKFPYSAHERHIMENWRQKIIYGTRKAVVQSLNKVQSQSAADEPVVVNLGNSPEGMVRSAQLITEVYQMPHLYDSSRITH